MYILVITVVLGFTSGTLYMISDSMRIWYRQSETYLRLCNKLGCRKVGPLYCEDCPYGYSHTVDWIGAWMFA